MQKIEGSPELTYKFDIVVSKLSRQLEIYIIIFFFKLDELFGELLDLGLQQPNCGILLCLTCLKLRFDIVSLGSGLIEEGL